MSQSKDDLQQLYTKTLDGYASHFKAVAQRLKPICTALQVNLTSDTIQAAAFTTYRMFEDAKSRAAAPAPAAGAPAKAAPPAGGEIPKLKLVNVGDEANLIITACRKAVGKMGTDIYFEGTRTDGTPACVYINEKTALRQLGRMGIDEENLALALGRTFRFARSHNENIPTKPYWDIYDVTPRGSNEEEPPIGGDFEEPLAPEPDDDLPF